MAKIILDGHFELPYYRWKKLILSYLKKEYIRSHIRYWKTIKNEFKSVEIIAKETNRSHWSVRDALKIDKKLGLVEIKKTFVKGKAPIYNFYRLTNKGNKLLNILGGVDM